MPNNNWEVLLYSSEDGQAVYDILQQLVMESSKNTELGMVEKLERLAALHRNGALDDDEFAKAKQNKNYSNLETCFQHHENGLTKRAHLTLGILRESKAVFYAYSFFQLDGFAFPAHQRVTPAVRLKM